MTTTLICPVCKYSEVETNCCPKCETDISVMRMVIELPTSGVVESQTSEQEPKIWWPIALAILILILGISLGAVSTYLVYNLQPSLGTNIEQNQLSSPVLRSPEVETSQPTIKNKNKADSGFYYTVRRGDSVSLVAWRFYGNGKLAPLIVNANPFLKGRESALEVGEVLFVPNLQEDSSGRF